MRFRLLLWAVLIGLPLLAYAENPVPNTAAPQRGEGASALQASNLLNPNISVVGWFQGMAGHPHDPGHEAEPVLQLKETEVALQAVVDPWARGDFFVSFDQDGQADLEE